MGVNGEALQLHVVHKKPYFYYKSRKNLYCTTSHTRICIVVQVMQESISGSTSDMRASERAMKSKVHMIKSL